MRRRSRPPLAYFVRLALVLLAAAFPRAVAAQATPAAADSAWQAGNDARAFALYAQLLAADSTDVIALHRLAQLLAERDRYDESLLLLERLLALRPADRAAAISRARVLAGRGDLSAAEARWRELHAQDTADQVVIAGLARTLRWQGRDAAAHEVLVRARPPLPEEVELAREMRVNRGALRPHAVPSLLHERDSEENRGSTYAAGADWRPAPRMQVQVEGWLHAARDSISDARVLGATFGVWLQREPGWNIGASLGASDSDRAGASTFLDASASVATPLRTRAGGSVTVRTGALDASALLIRNEVRITEAVLDGWYRSVHWRIDGSLALAELYGRVSRHDNLRRSATVTFTRPLAPALSVGARVQALGYDEESTDGYFSPDSYTLAELVARYGGTSERWLLALEATPGVQRVNGGPLTGSWRASGRVGMQAARGREISLQLCWARSAAQTLASRLDPADYRYFAAHLAASWSF